MTGPHGPNEGIALGAWLALTRDELGGDLGLDLTPDEQTALLDIARIAAHRSERIAAPMTTFLAGVAVGTLPSTERAARLRTLADRLDLR